MCRFKCVLSNDTKMLMFLFKKVTLRKVTIYNSVKYIAQSEQTRERDIKRNTIKNKSLPRKQNKNVSQNKKNSLQT